MQSGPSRRAQGCVVAPGTGSRGLRPSSDLRFDPPKHSGWVLPLDVPLIRAEGQWDILQLPGVQRALHGHSDTAAPVLWFAHQRSSTPQGCMSPESADLSPAPKQPGQLKPEPKETLWREQRCFAAAAQRTCPSAPGTKTWETPQFPSQGPAIPRFLTG